MTADVNTCLHVGRHKVESSVALRPLELAERILRHAAKRSTACQSKQAKPHMASASEAMHGKLQLGFPSNRTVGAGVRNCGACAALLAAERLSLCQTSAVRCKIHARCNGMLNEQHTCRRSSHLVLDIAGVEGRPLAVGSLQVLSQLPHAGLHRRAGGAHKVVAVV